MFKANRQLKQSKSIKKQLNNSYHNNDDPWQRGLPHPRGQLPAASARSRPARPATAYGEHGEAGARSDRNLGAAGTGYYHPVLRQRLC